LLRAASLLLAALAALLAGSPAAAQTRTDPPRMTEVVVTLEAPPLAGMLDAGRSLYAHRNRLDLRAPASVSYLARLAATQRQVQARITHAVPEAFVRWRYQVVVDGFALVVPADETARVARLPGVAAVYPSLRYHPTLDRSPQQIGAPALWGPGLATAGHGIKIGILDDGIDQTHPFFDPTGFTMPAGFPKGQRSYTTAKVIAARAFAPPYLSYRGARLPFDPRLSFHGTHVAGIAAGDPQTVARGFTGSPHLNGIAPEAYLGNYKVLGTPTPQFGADGNSPEIVAGIEAAVRDGMDVLNMSFGEPEIAPSRDIVVKAIDAAAKAGVVSAISAGNDFDEFGNGTVSSPANAPAAITAAAVTTSRSGTPDVIGDFSSAGPTPVSLKFKPDVSSPGVNILSAQPRGRWAIFSGTSMAAPHVAGAAALLRERHPTWTVAQIKSALVLTGDPAFTGESRTTEASTMREGGGVIDLPKADDPELFASPTDLSFGLLRGRSASRKVTLADAGGGAGAWTAAVAQQSQEAGVTIGVPASVTAPGTFTIRAAVGPKAAERDMTGFVVLTRGTVRRRIPYWFRVEAPRLAGERHRLLRRPGTYRDDARRGAFRVVSYRYPDDPSAFDLPTRLLGPEVVYRVRIAKPVANFGVAVVDQASGSRVMPRIVVAGDENRLVGETALPLDLNPYLDSFQHVDPVAGVVLPALGSYDVVFDTPSRARAGRFRFRYWVNDTTRPTARLLRRRPSGPLVLAVADRGSGVDPRLMSLKVDGRARPFTWDFVHGRVDVTLTDLAAGKHRLVATVSDYQEAKNMEDVHRILPNTRVLRATFKVS
jgi:subtilisin family serine protease